MAEEVLRDSLGMTVQQISTRLSFRLGSWMAGETALLWISEIVSNFVNFLSLWIYCNIYSLQTINNSPSPLRSRCFLLCSFLLCFLLLCSLCLNVSRQEAISWVLMSSAVVYKASSTRWTEQGIAYNLLHRNCLRLWLVERSHPIGCRLLQHNYQHQFLVTCVLLIA